MSDAESDRRRPREPVLEGTHGFSSAVTDKSGSTQSTCDCKVHQGFLQDIWSPPAASRAHVSPKATSRLTV